MSTEKTESRMKRVIKRGWPFAVAGVVGAALGGAAANGAVMEPKTVARTVEVTAEPEPVPTPTVTVTAEPKPAPTVTVTPEPVVKEVEVEVTDPLCRDVSRELWSVLQDYTNQVTVPYSDLTITLVDQLQYGIDVDTINGATETLQNVTRDVKALGSRITDITPDYQSCTAEED